MYAEVLTNEFIAMPPTIDFIIMALCADYQRRKEIICSGDSTYRIIMEYRFLNYRILNAATEVAGRGNAETFINEIGAGTGYTSSLLWRMSESSYKRQKQAIKCNIAKHLCLYE